MALPASTAGIAAPLVQEIVKLHTRVGNVRLSPGQTVVFGTGCTLLIAAVEYAYQQMHGGMITVFSKRPAYESYKHQSAVLKNTTFSYDENLPAGTPILEFVCVPNNPTGESSKPIYNDSFVVYDTVYNWPGAAPITPDIDAEVVLFSLSKLTGHAGTRFGWALVKDPRVAALMTDFIDLMEVHTSIDGQRRALSVLQAFNSGTVMDDFFAATGAELTARFKDLDVALFSKSGYELASVKGLPYAWVHCTRDSDCKAKFLEVGVLTRSGTFYGGTPDYLRLVVVESAAVWAKLLLRLAKL
jgi:L-tryptophan--pyruvate aminotransferase